MSIHQHYRTDEHLFVDHILEWLQHVRNKYSYKRSDFLDPRQQEIAAQLVARDPEVNVFFSGGTSYAERKRAIFAPDYFNPQQDDFQLVSFELRYPDKFVSVSHRQVLGALMGIGLKREKFGDIFIRDKTVQIVAAREIADFIVMNLQSVGKTSVSLRAIPLSELIVPENEWKEFRGTTSSLRLDAVISVVYNMSRSKAVSYIKAGLAKVNWKIVEQPGYACQARDTISLKGYGRSKLIAINGKTRKDKWRIQYGKK